MVVLLAVICATVDADGKYWPERAYPKPPSIPTQRALLVYRGGQERLIIESALDGEGQSFGWVIPLPSAPTELSVATPGILDTLEYVTQPRIAHDQGDVFLTLMMVVVLAALFGGQALSTRRRPSIIFSAFLVILMFVVSSMFLPALGRSAAMSANSVRVLQASVIGSYDVTVLEATDSSALDTWLRDNGFAALSDEEKRIVGDYIKDKWVFVASKLRRDGTGLSVPHPISMAFNSANPVYPMRLTAASGGPVALDLYVVADGRASCSRLKTAFSDSYNGPMNGQQFGHDGAKCYDGDSFGVVGHEALVALFWNRCTLTKLSANLTPQDMRKDFAVGLSAARPYRRHVYTVQGAFHTGVVSAVLAWSALLVLAAFTWIPGVAREKGQLKALKLVIAPITGGAVILLGLVYVSLPKIDVVTVGRFPFMRQKQATLERALLIEQYLQGRGENRPTLQEARGDIAEAFRKKGLQNPLTGQPLRESDSPGDYMLFEDGRGIVFRSYDWRGFRDEWVIIESKKAIEDAGGADTSG